MRCKGEINGSLWLRQRKIKWSQVDAVSVGDNSGFDSDEGNYGPCKQIERRTEITPSAY